MASKDRATPDRLALYKRLADNIHEYSFFQVLRLVEKANPDKPRIGSSSRPVDDPIRLGQEPHLVFAPSTLAEFKLTENELTAAETPPRLNVFFFGLFGPNGPLPLHLTEKAREQIRYHQDSGFSRFADIFHHRLLTLFYRAWSEARPEIAKDTSTDERFSQWVASLVGIGSPELRGQDDLEDYAKLYYSARFSSQSRSAEGLLAVVKQYFCMKVRLQQFIGRRLDIPNEYQLRLGDMSMDAALGVSTTLGRSVWECQSKFRLSFGPLNLEDYYSMLPGGDCLARLVAIVRNYAGDEFDWDIQLILGQEAIKPAQLGSFGQLGWSTWLYKENYEQDQTDLYLDPIREMV